MKRLRKSTASTQSTSHATTYSCICFRGCQNSCFLWGLKALSENKQLHVVACNVDCVLAFSWANFYWYVWRFNRGLVKKFITYIVIKKKFIFFICYHFVYYFNETDGLTKRMEKNIYIIKLYILRTF